MKRTESRRSAPLLPLFAALLMTGTALAQDAAPATPPPPPAPAGGESAELAKKLSNPISNLVSVPFQFSWEQGAGPNKATRFILNVQPVMPFAITKSVNLIARVIVPLVSQPVLIAGGAPTFGVSDVLTSFFFSPSKPSSFIWGVGPVISLPSTSEPTLGTGKWSMGPTFVALKQSGRWTVGALANQVWSVGGATNRKDVSQFFVQPFLAHVSKSLWTITLSSESVANWKADKDQWTVPIILSAAKLASFGIFPASYMLGVGVYAVRPDGAPSWKLRGQITVIMPKKK